jgi:hypothetical protein
MQALADYVQSIHADKGSLRIAEQTSKQERWTDQGFEVTREVADFRFEDGVVIRRTTEQDQFPTELACAECWIEYRVIESAGRTICPQHKQFDNHCREAWWLRYHTA